MYPDKKRAPKALAYVKTYSLLDRRSGGKSREKTLVMKPMGRLSRTRVTHGPDDEG
jgi:hypothetical protein